MRAGMQRPWRAADAKTTAAARGRADKMVFLLVVAEMFDVEVAARITAPGANASAMRGLEHERFQLHRTGGAYFRRLGHAPAIRQHHAIGADRAAEPDTVGIEDAGRDADMDVEIR